MRACLFIPPVNLKPETRKLKPIIKRSKTLAFKPWSVRKPWVPGEESRLGRFGGLGLRVESLQGFLLGGSGVVIGRLISPLIWVIAIVTQLITLQLPEPPSMPLQGISGLLA